MSFWVRRTAVGSFVLNDLGLTLEGSGAERDLSLTFFYEDLLRSASLVAAFAAGDIIRINTAGGYQILPPHEFDDAAPLHDLSGASHKGQLDGDLLKLATTPLCFRADGYLRPAAGIDITELDAKLTDITKVVMRRAVAGTSGTTEVDIFRNGSTIFTTGSNRPKILYSDGDDARVEAIPDVTSFDAGDKLELSILTVEGGNPQDVVVIIRNN